MDQNSIHQMHWYHCSLSSRLIIWTKQLFVLWMLQFFLLVFRFVKFSILNTVYKTSTNYSELQQFISLLLQGISCWRLWWTRVKVYTWDSSMMPWTGTRKLSFWPEKLRFVQYILFDSLNKYWILKDSIYDNNKNEKKRHKVLKSILSKSILSL